MAGEMVTAADGSHPTGMHSCCNTDEIKKKVRLSEVGLSVEEIFIYLCLNVELHAES